jgi:hypothetical protein
VRARHINSVITSQIIPIIHQQALYGIAQTTLALIPSDTPLPTEEPESEFSFKASTPAAKQVEVIGFSSTEEPVIVRLEGHLNRTEFWRPQATVQELEHVLREKLNADFNLRGAGAAHLPTPRVPEHNVPPKPQRRNFFERVADVMSPTVDFGTGETARNTTQAGQVLVKARLEEISLRTVNEFGLYDTMTKQCVIVRVDARC